MQEYTTGHEHDFVVSIFGSWRIQVKYLPVFTLFQVTRRDTYEIYQ